MDQKIDTSNGTYVGAKGGTELQYEKLISSLRKDYTDNIQIICSRPVPLIPNKKYIFYVHDHYTDPVLKSVGSEYWDKIDYWVFVSNTQFNWFHLTMGIPYEKSIVIENSIIPIEDHEKDYSKINLIYHTTPHRGLNILYSAFEHLSKKYSNLYLDVYSSFSVYGWPERDEDFKSLFDLCKAHPKINYHGAKSNSEVKEALKKSHIFAYPSIWPETSCIAAIEAMSAKNLVVCSDLGALAETVGHNGFTYRYSEDINNHFNIFVNIMEYVIKNEIYKNPDFMYDVKSRIDKKHCWEANLPKWDALCKRLLNV